MAVSMTRRALPLLPGHSNRPLFQTRQRQTNELWIVIEFSQWRLQDMEQKEQAKQLCVSAPKNCENNGLHSRLYTYELR